MLLSPSSLSLYIDLQGNTLLELCELVLPLLPQVGLPSIQEWEIPQYSGMRSQGLEQKLEELRNNQNNIDIPLQSKFALRNDIILYIYRGTEPTDVWDCDLHFYIQQHHTYEDLQTFLNSAIELCRQLLHRTHVYSAKIIRQGGYGRFTPIVPISGDATHLILTTHAQVEQSYDHPEVFWNAGWSSIEQFGEQYLLLRCLDKLENLAFLQAVEQHLWNMARAAKAGLIKYYYPEVEPEEEEIFFAGEPRLNIVGYSAEEQIIEYTCCVEADEHIQGWEIYKLREWVREGTLEDGRPINGIRVVFPNEEMAQREKRPLLDIGVKVIYLNYMSEDVEITE